MHYGLANPRISSSADAVPVILPLPAGLEIQLAEVDVEILSSAHQSVLNALQMRITLERKQWWLLKRSNTFFLETK